MKNLGKVPRRKTARLGRKGDLPAPPSYRPCYQVPNLNTFRCGCYKCANHRAYLWLMGLMETYKP